MASEVNWEAGIDLVQRGLCGWSLQDADLAPLPPAIADWAREPCPERLKAVLRELLGCGLELRAAQTIWLAAREGEGIASLEDALWNWATTHDDPHVRTLAALALACGGGDRARALELAAVDQAAPPPVGIVTYRGLDRIWASTRGHDGAPDPAQFQRCAACRGRARFVWEDLYGDNSGRQETREYRCADCGLFTTHHLDD